MRYNMRNLESEGEILTDKERKNLAILETVKRSGPISKADVSKITKLNIVTVSNYVNDFVEKGLILERGLDVSSGGRRPTMIELNPKAYYVIGIDLAVNRIIGVLTDLDAKVIAKEKAPRPKDNAEAVINTIVDIISKLIKVPDIDSKKINGICIGASGVIDREAGTVRCTEGIASIYVPVNTLLDQKFGIPAMMEHDATAAAYGEWSVGLGTDARVMLYMYSGVGCGIIINGEIYRGVSGTAGEVSLKELLDYSSNWAQNSIMLKPWDLSLGMPDEAKEAFSKQADSRIFKEVNSDLTKITTDVIFKSAKENDRLAIELLEKAGERLGVRISFLVNLLNPGVVVIGGGIEAAGPPLIDAIKRMIKTCCFEEMAEAVKIIPARLGEDSVAIGAASLVVRKVFAQA
ncbi:MAG: hypothetical protein COW11_06415 [Candidatus Omnitrophica bacterium CG12_big_fil_rev_8_21_14_0_65_43_15]|uniref:HTH marR-type domain-containing protein n=1 Tax=Candidatus Taenaricola geysiri TaxID=1974752 RepID=A0A2J0LDE0_9BACT|nr:MAG: hypothetical protein COS48_02910 [Candidatus Omnitrophica bacterium CG03_land_8_20_14_0_80_43_22]PIW65862.1 MAG: hypothetical protein COW11_06415 [Candidatus Omnitrophica bacterium CG12_big_fil_rev_8_21_14_0_65_43_15]PIW80103.1 MAG: hypothetical protein COZ98_04005 [Candidatus Omnitrophica bacterium CG_4_8_14_3_um_filter_43_15]PIY84369.1 MAG: hypothetical protein COY77_02795 [Candidatus Omnitrophica bacterium CG_4_10_14_0_8_um_filter_43_18]PJC46756.1 MAG: hypothetical protein CO036_0109